MKKLKRIVKSLDKDERSTSDKIDDYIFDLYNKPHKSGRTPSFAPSSLGAKCLRKIYYGYWKVEKDLPTNTKSAKIFATGDMYEDMLMGWLKAIDEHIPYLDPKTGMPPLRKGKQDPQFPISSKKWDIRYGLIDNVAIVNGELWIYEIKSSKEEKFEKLKEPQEDHKVQAGIYLQAFNELLAVGEYSHIPELEDQTKAIGIKYFYINKNNSEIKEYRVLGDELEKYVAGIEKRVETMKDYTEQKKLPPKTDDYCFFCSYKLKCKKNWNSVTQVGVSK